MNIEKIYKNYKKLLLVPIILLTLSILFLAINNATKGELIERDISLKGGISVTLYKEDLNKNQIESSLKQQFPDIHIRTLTDLSSRKDIGLIIESSIAEEPELKESLKTLTNFKEEDYSSETTGSKFGESFYKDLLTTILFAFLFMAIVVLITFRTFIPSIAVISAALIDIIVTLAIISLMGIQLSSAGIVAFILVIGYSIDTDILLTTRLLKRKQGYLHERLKGAITTGLTMTITTLAAITTAYLFSTSLILKQMFLIILIALIVDIIATYFGNASILIWYCKKKNIT
ncbi:MAG: hypothetical protein KJ674_00240 [Nanoarchaeota archaeon]|nr:hypothetical protein [Nanoarchaeota archaeon]